MESFIEVIPVTGSWKSHRKFSCSVSRRRPRTTESPCRNQGAIPLPYSNRHFAVRIVSSTASPGRSQSRDDKQKNEHKSGRSKHHYEIQNLEMGWKFQTRSDNKPVTCKTCNGTGRVECSWCHATGILMLGDRLMCSVEGRSHCLACDNGEVKCKGCKGTGMVASWMVMKGL